MKKKELLAMEPLYATDIMLQTARDNAIVVHKRTRRTIYGTAWTETRAESKYGKYYRAVVQGDLLKVAVFGQRKLEENVRTPAYEVYVNRKENQFLTYEPLSGKWRTAKISMLEFPDYSYLYCSGEWQLDTERKAVNEYFETGKNLSIGEAVLEFQANVRQEDLRRRHKNECDQIDAVMREVPELPADFEEWIIKNCFRETLFYEPEKGHKWPRMYCTHCSEWMDTQSWPNRPQHGKETTCPRCGEKAIFRSWNKQKYVDERIDVGILQRLMDGTGWILRNFKCQLKRRHEKGWENMEFWASEDCRARLDENFTERELFEYGEYKYTGVDRWCHECRNSNWGGYYNQYGYTRTFGRTYMYTPNLKEELWGEAFSGMDLAAIFKSGQRERVDSVFILQRLHRYPFLEYLQKSGLTVLVDEIMKAREKSSLFDIKQQRIHEVLRLDRQRFQRLRKNNGGSNILEALQYERQSGERISDQNLAYMSKNDVGLSEIYKFTKRTGMNVQRMLNYLERQQALTGQSYSQIRRHYEDYLDMAVGRGMDIRDEIVCKQPRLMEYHDRYLEDKNRKDAEARDLIVDNKFPEICAQHKQNKEHFAFETEEFVVWIPRKASDITEEGRKQHHCVGASDAYLKKMSEGKSYILFLRRKADAARPYYTLEVKWNGQIEQFYGAYDRQPDKEKIEALLAQFTKIVQERELENRASIRMMAAG